MYIYICIYIYIHTVGPKVGIIYILGAYRVIYVLPVQVVGITHDEAFSGCRPCADTVVLYPNLVSTCGLLITAALSPELRWTLA